MTKLYVQTEWYCTVDKTGECLGGQDCEHKAKLRAEGYTPGCDENQREREFVELPDPPQLRACPEGCHCGELKVCPNGLDHVPEWVIR